MISAICAVAALVSLCVPGVTRASPTCTTVLPLLEFTFSQEECTRRAFVDTIGGTFTLAMGENNTARCPIVNGFEYAARGLTRIDTTEVVENTQSTTSIRSTAMIVAEKPTSYALNFTSVIWLSGILRPGYSQQTLFVISTLDSTSGTVRMEIYSTNTIVVKMSVSGGVYERYFYFDNGGDVLVQGPDISFQDMLYNSGADPVYIAFVQEQSFPFQGGYIYRLTVYVGNSRTGTLRKRAANSETGYGALSLYSDDYSPRLFLGRRTNGNGNYREGARANYHYLAFYNTAFTQTDVIENLGRGTMNSVPSVKSGFFIMQMNETGFAINLTTSATAFDFDGDPIRTFTLETLPVLGTLYVNGAVAVTHSCYGSRAAVLTFVPASPYAYTIASSGSTCNATAGNYTSFTFRVSDGHGDSIQTATATVCIVDADVAPVVYNVNLTSVFVGSSRTFALQPSNVNTYPYSAIYPAGSIRIKFTSDILGTYGMIRRASSATACDLDYILQDSLYGGFVTIAANGGSGFYLCYETYVEASTTYGTDNFTYVALTAAGTQSTPATIFVTAVSPLEICPATPTRPAQGLVGFVSACESFGYEFPELVPVYLMATDHLASVLGRTHTLRIDTLPAHGTLYLADGDSVGDAVAVGAVILPVVTGVVPVLWYVGDAYFFTRVGASTYANYKGLGWDGCAVAAVHCRCALAVAPGCPDTFRYHFTTEVLDGYPEENSSIATYAIHVQNVLSPILPIAYPATVNVSYDTRSSDGKVYVPLNAPPIRIQDPDDNAYQIAVDIVVSRENVIMNMTALEIASTDYEFGGGCIDVRLPPCPSIRFMSYPDKADGILPNLVVVSTTRSVFPQRIEVKVYKPDPIGMTDTIFSTLSNSDFDQRVRMPVAYGNVTVAVNSNDANVALWYAIELWGTIAFGLTTCICCFCLAFIRGIETVCRSLCSIVDLPCFCCIKWLIHRCIPSFDTKEYDFDMRIPVDANNPNGPMLDYVAMVKFGGGRKGGGAVPAGEERGIPRRRYHWKGPAEAPDTVPLMDRTHEADQDASDYI